MSLSRIQKIGIVLSVIWIVMSGLFIRNYDIRSAHEASDLTNIVECSQDKYSRSCIERTQEDFKNYMIDYANPTQEIIANIISLIGFISLMYLALKLYRWIFTEVDSTKQIKELKNKVSKLRGEINKLERQKR
jgi:hypothetical protein